ncbi:MAG: hypothetical protein Kow0010_11090 [Dehalococcoidia bacterium]
MIFIDRSIPKSVATALKAVRGDVLWLEDVFVHDASDIEWLSRAGTEGWLVIVRDKKIRTRPGERAAIARAGVGCFVIEQKRDPTRWEYLKLLASTLDEMEARFYSEPRPFICAVTQTGRLRRVV